MRSVWRPHWRKMTWVLIAWILLIIWIAVAGIDSNPCAHLKDCEPIGTDFSRIIVLLFGLIGFAFLSLIWFISKPRSRKCPVCGGRVKRRITVCPSCDHDFAAAAAAGQPSPG